MEKWSLPTFESWLGKKCSRQDRKHILKSVAKYGDIPQFVLNNHKYVGPDTLANWTPDSWTGIERRLNKILRELKYLGFEHNYPINVEGKTFFGDFVDPLLKIVFEADGHMWHKDKFHEAERDALIRKAGYEIWHFTGSQIINTPTYVRAEVRRIVKEKMNKIDE